MNATATRRRTTKTTSRSRKSKPERAVAGAARFGLAARGCFYLLLAGLVVNLAAEGNRGPQADAKGALETVTRNPGGEAAVVAVAVGFLIFGGTRLWSAWDDRRSSPWRRTTTALQGAFYVALSWIPASYVLGNHQTGSNKSQHRVAGDLLRLPAGRELVAALGVIVIGVCANQVRTALTHEYADGMDTKRAPAWVGWLVRSAAVIGIPARALVFVPLGVSLIVAAVQSDPSHAKGLDQLLAKLSGEWWGVVLLVVAACGLVVFATYSFLEARYRRVLRAQ
ncbi:MAG TPA: DUF1206 domain-containing protein [Mycobacteriales bacterium]|nr:DUF1206 domain-containing protein [Mycobacteriales bacterium]